MTERQFNVAYDRGLDVGRNGLNTVLNNPYHPDSESWRAFTYGVEQGKAEGRMDRLRSLAEIAWHRREASWLDRADRRPAAENNRIASERYRKLADARDRLRRLHGLDACQGRP